MIETASVPQPTEPELSELARLHVLTPWLQSWRYILGFFGALVAIFRDNLSEVDDAWRYLREQPLLQVIGIVVGGLLVVFAVLTAWAYVSWRMMGYAVIGDTLFLRRGVLMRQRRQVRLNRLQGVDVHQPLLARLFGLAELKLELAAGGEATTTLGLLSLSDAHGLRRELLARAQHGIDPATGEVAEPPEQPILSVPTERVLLARLLDLVTMLPPMLVYLAIVAVIVLATEAPLVAFLPAVAVLGPWVLFIGGTLIKRFLSEANFSLGRSPDGWRIHSGLLSLNHRTVPERRVQGIHYDEPLTWRPVGWSKLIVDVAGSIGRGSDSLLPAANTLVPVAARADVWEVFVAATGMDPLGLATVPVPRRTRWLDPFQAGWLGVALADHAALTRTGYFTRRISVVPYARVQSVRITQGPLQRALRVATVHVDGAAGSSGWTAPHRDADDARLLAIELTRRAQVFRRGESGRPVG